MLQGTPHIDQSQCSVCSSNTTGRCFRLAGLQSVQQLWHVRALNLAKHSSVPLGASLDGLTQLNSLLVQSRLLTEIHSTLDQAKQNSCQECPKVTLAPFRTASIQPSASCCAFFILKLALGRTSFSSPTSRAPNLHASVPVSFTGSAEAFAVLDISVHSPPLCTRSWYSRMLLLTG